jgi:hypothetical protein
MTARIVHVVFHTRVTPVGDEDRLIGVFELETFANEVVERLRGKPGFRDAPDGLGIDNYTLDEDGWREGFSWPDGKREVLHDSTLECLPVDPDPDVFMLEHRRVVGTTEQCCLIGLYSSHQSAIAAAHRASSQEGFRSFVHGFRILGLRVDVVHWPDGFDSADARLQQLLTLSLSSLPPIAP